MPLLSLIVRQMEMYHMLMTICVLFHQSDYNIIFNCWSTCVFINEKAPKSTDDSFSHW